MAITRITNVSLALLFISRNPKDSFIGRNENGFGFYMMFLGAKNL